MVGKQERAWPELEPVDWMGQKVVDCREVVKQTKGRPGWARPGPGAAVVVGLVVVGEEGVVDAVVAGDVEGVVAWLVVTASAVVAATRVVLGPDLAVVAGLFEAGALSLSESLGPWRLRRSASSFAGSQCARARTASVSASASLQPAFT